MLHRPSKAVMAKIVEAFGALLAALTQPFVSHDVGYAQVVPGQKSRKVRNHMLKSPFKSVIARMATFALVLSLGIAFVTVGLAPSASAQMAEADPCKQDAVKMDVTCDYDENGTDPVANFSAMDPEGEMIVWSLGGADASDFDIPDGVLSFKKSPDYEDPKGTPDTGTDTDDDNSYEVMVVATEVRAPGSLDLAKSNEIMVTVNVKNIEEDPTLTLDRLQVRAGVAGATITATLTDPDMISGTPGYKWFVPKVSRPDLENDDHWTAATGGGNATDAYVTVAGDAGKRLRVVATYTDGFGTESDKAYARSAHPVAAERTANNDPLFPASVTAPVVFKVSEHVAVGTVIGTVRGSDVDSSDILSHELTANNTSDGKFAIDIATGRITVKSKLNYEDLADANPRQYTFTVTAHDPSGGDTGARTVNVEVSDQNDAPSKPTVGVATDRTPLDAEDSTMPSYMVVENHAVKDVEADGDVVEVNAVVVATFAVADGTDPDDGDPASTLKLTAGGADGGLFSLTNTAVAGGTEGDNTYELVFKESPNYESPADADGNNKYHVTIITADNEGASSELPLVITVMNVNEDGKVTLSTTQPAVGQPVTATLTDPDMKITEVSWQWGRSSTDGGYVAIQGATSDTYTPVKSVKDDPVTTANEGVDGDEGMYLEVKVTYVDNASHDEDDATTDKNERTRTVKQQSDNAVREEPDVNQAPMFESGITREAPEDAKAGGKVGGPVEANDPDGDALSYSITGGADMGAFEIGSTSGQITVKKGTMLDYEGSQTTYMVEVTGSDPFGLEASTMVTIMVTDVNEKPEVTAPGDPCKQDATTMAVTCEYDEKGTDPVANFSGMDPEGEMIVWSLAGADASDFDIPDGVLSFKKSPDYEDPKGTPDTGTDTDDDNSYEVMVVATEVRAPGSLDLAKSNEIMVTVNVKNIEEDPTLTLDRLQVRAGVAGATITATLTDPDMISGTPGYKWFVPKVSRPDLENDDHWTAATGGGNATDAYVTVAGDAGKRLRVVATYTDGFGTESDKAYARSAHPVAAERTANNDPLFPASVTAPVVFKVSEHVAVGTVIGTVRGSDVDSSDILSHELTANNTSDGKFAIDIATGRITVKSKLNYEDLADANPRQYTFTVTAHDPSGGDTGARTVNVEVSDQNDAPSKPTVGVATDRTPLDAEDSTMPSYMVVENHAVKDVEADGDVVEVNAVVVATFAVADGTDPDDGDPASTLKLTAGGADGGLFSLTNTAVAGGTEGDNTYELVFKESPNYESPADADGNNKYHVTIITADNEGATSELPLVITVMNVNEDGKVTLSTTQPAVGQPVTATLTDPDMKITEVSWQWGRSSTDGGYVAIQGATSDTYTPVKSVKDDPVTTANEGVDGDEGMYLEVKVTYVDNASHDEDDATTDKNERTRTVKQQSDNAVREEPDVNQAPMFESGITRMVPEDAGDGDKVGGPVTAADPDMDALTYTISGGADKDAFEIGSTSGQITVKKGTELDFEGSQTTYMVEVKATDPFGLNASTMVTITVTDVNEKPEVMLSGGETTTPSAGVVGGLRSVYVEEGTTTVGPYVTTIENPSSWTLSGPDAGDFSISSGGDLSFNSAPDYENPTDANTDNVYMVTVMANNGNGGAELDVTVTVTNDTSDDTTTMPDTFDPLSYDGVDEGGNENGVIDRPEVIQAIRDYFDDQITKDDVVLVIRAYFGNGS